MQALVEANNREWEKKYQKAVTEYEMQMSQTEEKYKADLKERNRVYE